MCSISFLSCCVCRKTHMTEVWLVMLWQEIHPRPLSAPVCPVENSGKAFIRCVCVCVKICCVHVQMTVSVTSTSLVGPKSVHHLAAHPHKRPPTPDTLFSGSYHPYPLWRAWTVGAWKWLAIWTGFLSSSLSISHLQFHCCGSPCSLTCCLISDPHTPDPGGRRWVLLHPSQAINKQANMDRLFLSSLIFILFANCKRKEKKLNSNLISFKVGSFCTISSSPSGASVEDELQCCATGRPPALICITTV